MNMHMAVNLIVMWIPDSLAYLDVLSYTLGGSIWADGLLFSITVLWFVSKHQANKAQEEGGSITFYSWKPCSIYLFLLHCACLQQSRDKCTQKKHFLDHWVFWNIVTVIDFHSFFRNVPMAQLTEIHLRKFMPSFSHMEV